MTDGPFKNLKLGSHWKRFAEAVQNDAVDAPERCALAAHALVHETLSENTKALLVDLQAYVNRKQLDLDPLSSVESIFSGHNKTPFSDTCQKEIAYRLSEQTHPASALRQAVEATVIGLKSGARNRIEEECIRVRESGEMREDQFTHTVMQARATFDSLAIDEICDALYAGNKNAFKEAISKKDGLDDGPSL